MERKHRRNKALSTEMSKASWCSLVHFFFSSRRRHTRCLSDWSSDVFSSDLTHTASQSRYHPGPCREHPPCTIDRRSEERRVGKDCRSRWSLDDQQKK